MYIRRRPIKGTSKIRIQVCESARVGEKVVQKTLRQVGVATDEMQLSALEEIARRYMHLIETKRQGPRLYDDFESRESSPKVEKKCRRSTPVKVENLQEVKRSVHGHIDIFSAAISELEIDSLVPAKAKPILNALIAERICEPASKRRTHQLLEKQGFSCSLQSIYRLLDCLGLQEGGIHQLIAKQKDNLFESTIDIMFFDVTTLYFESWNTDELRDFGYSKDCKFGQVQVTLALAANTEGMPIGYKLFPGNTAEVKTLIQCVNEWKNVLPLKDVIVVADRGMFSAENLFEICEAGLKFVVGCPLKKLPAKKKEQILSPEQYDPGTDSKSKEFFWHTRLEHAVSFVDKEEASHVVSGSLIVVYSSKRARKDAQDRSDLIERAKKKYSKKIDKKLSQSEFKELVGNRGHGKYLQVTGLNETRIEINQDAIDRDAQWDGISGIFTNASLTNMAALERYRGLWQIEDCFRLSKTQLRIRPVFHFSPARIRGHVALCFLSLLVLKFTQRKLSHSGIRLTPRELTDELTTIGTTTMKDRANNIFFEVPTAVSSLAEKICGVFKIHRRKSAKVIQPSL